MPFSQHWILTCSVHARACHAQRFMDKMMDKASWKTALPKLLSDVAEKVLQKSRNSVFPQHVSALLQSELSQAHGKNSHVDEHYKWAEYITAVSLSDNQPCTAPSAESSFYMVVWDLITFTNRTLSYQLKKRLMNCVRAGREHCAWTQLLSSCVKWKLKDKLIATEQNKTVLTLY